MKVTGLVRVARNSVSLLATNVVMRGTTFAIYVLIARYLGSREFGQLALALSLFHTFHIFSVFGLRNLITREVARDKSVAGTYFLNASSVVLVSSVAVLALARVFVVLMGYESDTGAIIVLLCLGLVPYALSAICEAIFRAWERMQYIAYTSVVADLLKLIAVVLLLSNGYGVVAVVGAFVVARILTLLLQWLLVIRRLGSPKVRIDVGFCRRMLVSSAAFMGLESVHAARASLAAVLLSKFGGEVAVGLFSAASQLRLPVRVLFVSVVPSVFPVMCRKVEDGVKSLKLVSETLAGFLLAVAIPAAIGLHLLSERLLGFLYSDPEFAAAAPVLQILAWTLVSNALTSALGQVLWASHREVVNLRITLTNFGLSLVFGVLLISQYSVIGAAVAELIVSVANLVQHHVPVSRLLSGHRLAGLFWQPMIASAVMGGVLLLLGNQNLFLLILLGVVTYGLSLAAIVAVTNGGIEATKERYRYLLSTS